MKKLLAFVLVITFLVLLVSCSSSQYEEKFLGTWVSSSGGQTIMYTFEYKDGVYSARCITGDYDTYLFDKYSASSKVITFYQDGTSTKHYYSFEDGYLYIDELEFEKR